MQTVLKYPGSKWSTADWIISNFPPGYEKLTYLEPFFGSGAVFFNKRRSVIETINDLDSNVVNLFKIIRERPEELARLIDFTPWAREEYRLSYEMSGDPLEDARRFLVRMWQAIGAKSSDKTGWRNNIKGMNGNLTQFNNRLPDGIIKVSCRLKHTNTCLVQIENQPAIQLIDRYNRDNVLMYIDPPYLLSTRSNRIYKHEMKDEDHEALLEVLLQNKARIILSGYDNQLYNSILQEWHKESINCTAEGGRAAVETIWMNYEPTQQMKMF